MKPHSAPPIPFLRRIPIFCAAAIALLAASPSSAGLIATGTFQSKEAGITASGNFEIQETAGKFKLVVKSDFQVSEGPDLFFTFNPLPAAQVTGSNAKTYALQITPQLKALKGAQTYDLPDGFKVDGWSSLLIHCWKYNHLYAAAVIKKEATSGLNLNSAKEAVSGRKAAGGETGPRISREGGRVLALDGNGDRRRFDFSGRTAAPVTR